MRGLITKGIGGFYYVKTNKGLIEAKGRGAFKNEGIKLAVGDEVELSIIDEEAGKGVIESIYPRRNEFIRPPIVNVDMFIIVLTPTNPKPNFALIDKFLIMSELHNVEAVVCINKCDLADEERLTDIAEVYDNIYTVIQTSTLTGQGLDKLKEIISGKTAALCGPSGVGKSTLLNNLIPHANMETGAISQKTKRGKHTTRHAEIFDVEGGGMLFDTPGFTSFEILEAQEDNLASFYPDIEAHAKGCRYDNCRHLKEPGCSVREAVAAGKIHKFRYDSYVKNIEKIRAKKKY